MARQELLATLEELHVTREELEHRNDELAALHVTAELERAEYQQLFEAAPVPYVVTDAAGTIRSANVRAGELLNVEPRFLVGKPLATYVVVEERHEFRLAVRRLGNSQAAQVRETLIAPRRAPPVPAVVRALPVAGDDGLVRAIRWTLTDVSSRAHTEQRLLKLNEELDQRARREA